MGSEDIQISERKTFISAGIIAILIGTAVSLTLYISTIDGKANENLHRISNLEQKRFDVDKRIFDQLNDIQEKVHKIQGYLEAQKK
jgi:hypothetical protein